MGQLQRNLAPDGSTDFTTLEQDVADAIGEINRNADRLDSFNQSLRIIARGTASLVASGGSYAPQTIALNPGVATSFMCFLTRSDQGGILYQVPYLQATGSPLVSQLYAFAQVSGTGITFQAQIVAGYASPPTLTFYYYMVSQPANSS